MTSLEELLERERQAVEPGEQELVRVERRLAATLSVGVTAAAATTALSSSTKLATLLPKMGAWLAGKAGFLWATGAVVGVGLGYSVAVLQESAALQRKGEETKLTRSSQLIEPPRTAGSFEASREAEPPTSQDPEVSSTPELVEGNGKVQAPAPRPSAWAPPVQAPKKPSDRLKEDARRLSRISAALNRGAPAEALRLLQAESYSGSVLAAEFGAARAIALCKLGRTAEAEPTVRSLEKHAPESPTRLRVMRACKN